MCVILFFNCLLSNGIGTATKSTTVLYDEDLLWESGVISVENLIGLLNAIFFSKMAKLLSQGRYRT